MLILQAHTLINEVRNLGWNQPVLNLLLLSEHTDAAVRTYSNTSAEPAPAPQPRVFF